LRKRWRVPGENWERFGASADDSAPGSRSGNLDDEGKAVDLKAPHDGGGCASPPVVYAKKEPTQLKSLDGKSWVEQAGNYCGKTAGEFEPFGERAESRHAPPSYVEPSHGREKSIGCAKRVGERLEFCHGGGGSYFGGVFTDEIQRSGRQELEGSWHEMHKGQGRSSRGAGSGAGGGGATSCRWKKQDEFLRPIQARYERIVEPEVGESQERCGAEVRGGCGSVEEPDPESRRNA